MEEMSLVFEKFYKFTMAPSLPTGCAKGNRFFFFF